MIIRELAIHVTTSDGANQKLLSLRLCAWMKGVWNSLLLKMLLRLPYVMV